MALQYDVKITTAGGHPCYGIYNPIYPGRPEFTSRQTETALSTGQLLEHQKGFPFGMEPPFASFKVLRAMNSAGIGNYAKYVTDNKHRSWVTPDYIFDGVLNYSLPVAPRHDSEHYNTAMNNLRKEFLVEQKIPVISWDLARISVPQSTSPGLPYIQNGIHKKSEALDEDFDEMVEFWNKVGRGKRTDSIPDCAAFARSHISDTDTNKVRPVWAYPITAILAEAKFAHLIINELTSQNIGKHTAYGMEMMKGGMTWLQGQVLELNHQSSGAQYVMTDYSAFDSSIPASLIRDCFRILREKIDFTKEMDINGNIVESDAKSNLRIFKKIESYFINTPIRNPDGRRFRKDHGVPSGSMFTNIIDTMINYLVTQTASLFTFGELPMFELYFGDDSLCAFPSTTIINLDIYSDNVDLLFGMTVNKKKSYYTTNPQNIHFLGYYNYRGTPIKADVDL